LADALSALDECVDLGRSANCPGVLLTVAVLMIKLGIEVHHGEDILREAAAGIRSAEEASSSGIHTSTSTPCSPVGSAPMTRRSSCEDSCSQCSTPKVQDPHCIQLPHDADIIAAAIASLSNDTSSPMNRNSKLKTKRSMTMRLLMKSNANTKVVQGMDNSATTSATDSQCPSGRIATMLLDKDNDEVCTGGGSVDYSNLFPNKSDSSPPDDYNVLNTIPLWREYNHILEAKHSHPSH
jgi:hypothetical protein